MVSQPPKLAVTSWLTMVVSGLVLVTAWRFAPINMWSIEVSRSASVTTPVPVSNPGAPPGHQRAVYWHAKAALARGDADIAVALLRGTGGSAPPDALTLALLGRAYEAQGQYDLALDAWQWANDWPDVMRAVDRAIDKEDWRNSELLLNAAESNNPEEVVIGRSKSLAGQRDFAGETLLLTRALDSWPKSAHRQEWLLFLGASLAEQRRWSEAIEPYLAATKLPNRDFGFWAYLGLGQAIYYSSHDLNGAAIDVARAIELRPDLVAGYRTMGELYQAGHRPEMAGPWFQRADEIQAAVAPPK